jgi:predicted MFS family arabinose efflux permease
MALHSPTAAGSKRANRSLDAANFFLADVRDGLGPYLAIYLLTVQKWDEASIGVVMSIATAAGILAQTPAGGLIDATRAKRVLMVVAAVAVTAASLLLPLFTNFFLVAASQATAHAAAAVFGPALAAISLGIVGHAAFTKRVGRNESFNHAGNAVAAVAAGATAYLWGPTVVFYLLAAMSAASMASILMIPGREIDNDLARGLHDQLVDEKNPAADDDKPSGLRVLITCKPLLTFAVAVMLFHLANAAMLPLVGQKLALQDNRLGMTFIAACIVAAQMVMVPMAMLVGARADQWGRKPLFLAGFLILPLRGCLYTLSDNQFWLLAVQTLDGVGAGIFGAIFPIIVADLMRGTGRFNVAQGAILTAQGIGAALSTTLAGIVVVHAGYSAAFLTLAGVAILGALVFFFGMPETNPRSSSTADNLAQRKEPVRPAPAMHPTA